MPTPNKTSAAVDRIAADDFLTKPLAEVVTRYDLVAIAEKYKRMEEALQTYKDTYSCGGCAGRINGHSPACLALDFDPLG